MRSGRQRNHLVQRGVEAVQVLSGQAVDQIHVRRGEACATRLVDRTGGLLLALQPVHGPLHGRIEILHPDGHAVEPQIGEEGHAAGLHRARVDLDGVLGARRAAEMAMQRAISSDISSRDRKVGVPPPQCIWQIARSSSPSRLLRRLDFLGEVFDILRRPAVVLGHHLVAGAVVADGVAEWHVHIDRERLVDAADVALREPLPAGLGTERLDEPVRGRVRGITRSVDVELANEVRVENQIFLCSVHGSTSVGCTRQSQNRQKIVLTWIKGLQTLV
jgi:hypothetical protein